MGTPTLKRSWGFVGASSNQTDVGDKFQVYLEPSGSPCAVTAGDLVLVCVRNPASLTPVVSDDQTNTWTSGVSANDGTSKYAIFWASAAASMAWIKVTFGSNTSDVQISVHIFYNCATSSPVDVSHSATGITPTNNTNPNVSAGSMTTTVNGDLIFNAVWDQSSPLGVNNPFNGIAFGSGFTGLHTEQSYGSITQFEVQATAGAVNAGLLVSQTTHDTFASLALAIKAGTGGSAPGAGIYILRSQMALINSVAETLVVDFPTSGNLTVVVNDAGTGGSSLTTVADSASNTWAEVASTPAQYPQWWWARNAAPSNSMTVSLTTTTTSGTDLIVMYDVVGAATSPLDTGASAANLSTLTVASSGATKNSGTQGSAGAQLTDASSITPSTSNGLIFACFNIGTGPASGVMGVSGETFDYVPATWSTTGGSTGDQNAFGNGDGVAHYFNGTAAAVNFKWDMSNTVASSWQAIAVAFKAAPAAATPLAIDDGDALQQRFVQSTRMEGQYQQELQDTFGILPTRPPFAFEDDGQNMRWSDWRALQYEEVDVHRALPPIPPFAIEDDAERQKNVNWSAIQYEDADTHRALPPIPPFAIVDEISERPLPGVTPFAEEDQPGKPIIVAPAPNIGLDDIEAHIKAFDRIATYYEDDVFNSALPPPLAQQDEISERTFNWSTPAIEDDWTALPPNPPVVQQDEISERWSGTSAVQPEEDQPPVPIIASLPPPSIEDDMGQRWAATSSPAIEDDWSASSVHLPFVFEDDLKSYTFNWRTWSVEEEAYPQFVSPAIGPFVLIAALRHATYSALVATSGHTTYSQLQASGGMQILDGGA